MENTMAYILGAAIAVGLGALAAAYGISKIGATALESIARQPEEKDAIRGTMILAFAFTEVVPLVAALVALVFMSKVM
jgi:F-type H+-transporting ATPase subunit c